MWGTEEKQESLYMHSYLERWFVHLANSKSLKRTQRIGGGSAPQKASSLPVDGTHKSAQEAGRRAGLGTARGQGSAPGVIGAGCRRRPSHLGEVVTQVKFLVLPQEPSIKRGRSSSWSFQTLLWLLKRTIEASQTESQLATVSR